MNPNLNPLQFKKQTRQGSISPDEVVAQEKQRAEERKSLLEK